MTDALKPCPFCGSDDVEALDMEGKHYAVCYDCALEGPFHKSRAAVIAAWNTRAALAAPAVPPDVMRDAERYRWLRTSNSHHLHNSAWLASLTAVKDGPCDIFSADEVPALLDAEIDRRMAAAPTAQQGASHEQP